MDRSRKKSFLLLGLALMVLLACNLPGVATPTPEGASAIYTAAAQTVIAQVTQVNQPPATPSALVPTFAPPTALPPTVAVPTNTAPPPTAIPPTNTAPPRPACRCPAMRSSSSRMSVCRITPSSPRGPNSPRPGACAILAPAPGPLPITWSSPAGTAWARGVCGIARTTSLRATRWMSPSR